jgi:hypothetical protein
MDDSTRQLVRDRAQNRCEYCHLPQAGHDERFSLDHVIARKHQGPDTPENLALCCLRCNLHKGTDLTGIDPLTRALVPLFNPRRQVWSEHFRWDGAIVSGTTKTGRTTMSVLRMNAPERVRLRTALLSEGKLRLD